MVTPGRPVPASRLPAPRLRRWWRRTTHGVTAAAVVLVVAPAVPVGESSATTAEAPATATQGPARSVVRTDLQLVGHRKPHPHRTIKRYRVRPGDTPSGIAVRFHAWTAQLLRINHTRTLYAGEVILVPVVTRVARECQEHRHHRTNVRRHAARPPAAKASKPAKPPRKPAASKAPRKEPAKTTPARKPKAAPARKPKAKPQAPHSVRHARGWHHRGFSRTEVRRVIVAKAKRHDVNPALALAVAWQESGWQHDRVSSAGAIGAMQIMPGTGRWMSALTGRRLNIRDLYDNVTAGVVLLRLLRDQAGPRVAVAGYYQGLAGVRRYGMYRSTKRYVDNVHALRKRLERGGSPL